MAGFRKATKKVKNLVLSIQGPSGAGKTFTALNVGKHLCPPGKRIAFIDTENSASLYANKFDFDVDADFGPFGKLNYGPDEWMKKLRAAAEAGDYAVVVLDSLTHMWKGQGGILWQLDQEGTAYKAKWNKNADSNALWKKYDPMYARFMNDLRHLPFHVIFCLRSKQKYDRKTNEKGKTELTKVGLEPEFRDGFEFDVDAQFIIDEDHVCVAKKHRLEDYLNGKVFENPGKNLADELLAWAADGNTVTQEEEEEPAPLTQPDPEILTEDASSALFNSLNSRLEKASSIADLQEVGKSVTAARKDGHLTDEQRDALAKTFTAKGKELKSQVAA
jgi:hypothetical protein